MSYCRSFAFLLVLVLVGCGCSRELTGPITGKGDPRFWKRRDLFDKHFSRHVVFSTSQSNDLVELNVKVQRALASRRCLPLQESVFILTNSFKDAKIWRAAPFEKELYRRFDGDIITGRLSEEYLSAEELEKRMSFDFELTVLLGETWLRSETNGGGAAGIEAFLLVSLERGRDYYRSTGQNEHERIVEKWRQRLIDYIESEACISRRSARQMFAYQKERVETIRDISMDTALKDARAHANGLIHCGYRPKWLDTDFPIDEAQKDEQEKLKGRRKDSSSGSKK